MRTSTIVFSFFAIGLFLFVNVVSADSAEDTTTFRIDVLQFPEIISIEVPDVVDLGNVTIGQETDPTSNDKIYIKNTGTFDVRIQPKLANPNDPVFKNLYFTWRLSGEKYSYKKVGSFSFDLPWSEKLGEAEEDYVYAKLDMRNVSNINNDMINYEADVIFVATSI